jgi:hypothetical protein
VLEQPLEYDHADNETDPVELAPDGVPLAGYEPPQGSGVALGRYWE